MTASRFLGVFIPAVYLQYEGATEVLDRLAEIGTTAICIEPTLGRPARPGHGVRFPDLHEDGYRRVVDRALWGRHELHLETFPGFIPDPSEFTGPYVPAPQPIPSDMAGTDVVDQTIEEARARGLEVHLLISPLRISGLSAADRPRLIEPDARPWPEIAVLACPSAPDARRYAEDLARSAVRRFPLINGLVLDWAEYSAYALHDVFACLCRHCEEMAESIDIRWNQLVADVYDTWRAAHRTTAQDLRRLRQAAASTSALVLLLAARPGWLDLIRLKSTSVTRLYSAIRRAMTAATDSRVDLTARGWISPWNLMSGMDYRQLSTICQAVAPKIFTFDFAALPRWYGKVLEGWNPKLREAEILDALVEILDLPDDIRPRGYEDYQIPGPTDLHPTPPAAYARRIELLVDQVGGAAPCYPIIHPGMPESQWKEMVTVLRDSPADGGWVNHYGYLSGPKLRAVRGNWGKASSGLERDQTAMRPRSTGQ